MAEAILNNSGLAGISSSDDATALRKYVVSTDKNGNAMTAVTHESGDEAIQGTLNRNRVLDDEVDDVGGLSKDLVLVGGGGNIADIVFPQNPSQNKKGTDIATIEKSNADRYLIIPPGHNPTKKNYKISKVPDLTLPSSADASAASGSQQKASFGRSTSDRFINIAEGYHSGKEHYKLEKVPNIVLPTSAAASADGTNKANITPGTAAKYINLPTGFNDAKASYKIEGDADLVAKNIIKGKNIFGVSGSYKRHLMYHSGFDVSYVKTKTIWGISCPIFNLSIWSDEQISDYAQWAATGAMYYDGAGNSMTKTSFYVGIDPDYPNGQRFECTGVDSSNNKVSYSIGNGMGFADSDLGWQDAYWWNEKWLMNFNIPIFSGGTSSYLMGFFLNMFDK